MVFLVSRELQDQMILIENEASKMMCELDKEHFPQLIESDQPSWRKRILNINDQWNGCRETYKKSRVDRECPAFGSCDCCASEISQYAICCKCCKKELCALCDQSSHANFPFHARILFKRSDISSTQLLPINIVEQVGEDIKIVVKGELSYF